jgi:hypothetical protein
MKKDKNLKGQVFNRWEIISDEVRRNGRGFQIFHCKCNRCNNFEQWIDLYSLKKGRSKQCKDCGSKQRAEKMTRHGKAKKNKTTRLYNCWRGMKHRCYYPKSPSYIRYGSKGITVCDEWLNSYEAFEAWALANGYRDDLYIDRIDGNGNYCPENCRWVTKQQNQMNQSHRLEPPESGMKGVYRRAKGKDIWRTRIHYLGKTYTLGDYKNEREGGFAYDLGALIYFKEFSTLNFPEHKEKYAEVINTHKEKSTVKEMVEIFKKEMGINE